MSKGKCEKAESLALVAVFVSAQIAYMTGIFTHELNCDDWEVIK